MLSHVRDRSEAFDESQEKDRRRQLRVRLRRDLVSKLGLGQMAAFVRSDTVDARNELSIALEALLNDEAYDDVPPSERPALEREVLDEILGLGLLQPLIDDDTVTEVMVNGCESLYYERGGKLHQAPDVFDSPEQIMVVIDRILAPLGRRLDESNPLVSARLPNGDRVNAVIDPVAIDGPVLTIRRFTGRIADLKSLVTLKSLPDWYGQLLDWAVKTRQDIAVAGGTGSGKTTLLNALSAQIPEGERVITIEDAAELSFGEHTHVVRLEARDASVEGKGRVTIRDLVTNALRMRPDRIVVGEVRGEECIDMLQAMNTGHDGSLTTLHAGSEQEAILRLVLMARFGMDLPADIIEEQVSTALDAIVMSKRLASGERRVGSFCEVCRGSDGKAELKPIVIYDDVRDSWKFVREPAFIETAIGQGLTTREWVNSWRSYWGLG
jgi:pilus assembly protein CpaF